MGLLHDASVRSALDARLRALHTDSAPRWGKMSVDQMLWHVNQAMAGAVGEVELSAEKAPLPRPMIRYLVLNMPWKKGLPTNPAFVPKGRYNFDAEHARCLRLIAALVERPLGGAWPAHPMFGAMSGRDVSRLHAKHLDHHLKQFGV